MPLYEFRCESCGHEVEIIMAFSDPLPATCEACGGALKKLLSAPAVQFKGSGFYLTDYGRSGSSADSGKRAADAGEAKGSTESKASGDAGVKAESKSSGEAKPSGETKAGSTGGGSGSGGDAKPAG
ncbi:MAG: FmdB family zinc ribbon protein [Thermoanaerobaculia bacterium]